MDIPNLAFRLADRHVIDGLAEQSAVEDGPWNVDFANLTELSASYGGALRQLGVQRGDRVLIVQPSSLESLVPVLGVFRLGAIAGVGGSGVVDTSAVDYGTAIKAGRSDPIAAARVRDDEVVLDVRDATALTYADAVALLATDETAPPSPLGDIVVVLRALAGARAVRF